jgi:hypothetical protein
VVHSSTAAVRNAILLLPSSETKDGGATAHITVNSEKVLRTSGLSLAPQ